MRTNNPEYKFFMYVAKPNPTSPSYETVGGAFVNAWASNKMEGDIDLTIRTRIEQEDWKVEDLQEQHIVTKQGYSENNELTPDEKDEIFDLLNSADEHGICLAFYEWDKEEQ